MVYWFEDSREKCTFNLKDDDQAPNAGRPSCGWLVCMRPEGAFLNSSSLKKKKKRQENAVIKI